MISQSILFRPNAKAVDKAPKQMLLMLRGIPPLSCCHQVQGIRREQRLALIAGDSQPVANVLPHFVRRQADPEN